MPTTHAFDYLAAPAKHPPAAVNVLFGDEAFLRNLVLKQLREQLADGRADVEITTFGPKTPWRDLNDELSTGSLFGGGGKRLVMLEDADDFVSQYREKLEDYVAKPKSTSALIVCVESLPSNTRLYKAVDASGLQINCNVPSNPRSKSKEPDVPKIGKWLVHWAKARHNIALDGTAADELVEIVGPHLGVMDQDLAKLALYVPAGGKVSASMVKEIIGGWRLRTAWQMFDDVADGKIADALAELDHLIRSGSEPIAIFGQLSWALRRYATATRIVQTQQRSKQKVDLQAAAKEAGFRPFPDELKKAERQLRQLSSARAGKLHRWLLDTDLALKGSHSQKDRARLAIEELFIKLAEQTAPAKR
jgi:DNA polymerase-3 subunit delta